MKKRYLIIYILCCTFFATQGQVPEADSLALVALYNSTNGSAWTDNTNWLQPGFMVSDWYGITVINDTVSVIQLTDNNLDGPIPPEIGNFTKLQHLYLYENNISGSIPPEIGNLDKLEYLLLQNNQLTGAIPDEIGNLENLENLCLTSNQLNSSIPAEIGDLSHMEEIRLDYNMFTGNIPVELGNLSNLVYLDLSYNQLDGSIPTEICTLSNLTHLFLDENELTGNIPENLGELSSLTYFTLSRNSLTGNIPHSIGDLSALRDFRANENQLNGTIPDEICNCSNLYRLIISENQFSGEIPADLWKFSEMEYLFLANNQFIGTIPADIGCMLDLRILLLDNNHFTGQIPEEMGLLTGLLTLRIGYNQFTGPLPAGLVGCPSLNNLMVQSNYFTFYDLEPMIGNSFSTFDYDPQLQVKTNSHQLNKSTGDSCHFDIMELAVQEIVATNNQYRWWKDGDAITEYADTSNLIITDLDNSDQGYYHCTMINSDFPDLTLQTDSVFLVIDGPVDITLSNNSVDENSETGTVIGTLAAEDADQTDGHTFELVEGNGANDADNDLFTIDGTDLSIQTSPDYETKHEYYINIRATDDDMKTFEKAFVIQVNDISESNSIQINPDENIKVYPNPADNFIFLLIPEGTEYFSYELFDITGKMLSGKEKCSEFEIALHQYPAGIYYLHLTINEQPSMFKILKK